MLKLGATFDLGANISFAAFQASVQQNALAINAVKLAQDRLNTLSQNRVNIDPQGDINDRLQNMIDTNRANQSVIEDIRDNQLTQGYQNLQVPVLSDTYLLGTQLATAEGQATTNNPNARRFIQGAVNAAEGTVSKLISDTPLAIPLNESNLADELKSLNPTTDGFDDLHNRLLFARGECQGIFDVTGPEPF